MLKKLQIFLIGALLFIFNFDVNAQVTSFPYNEDFEGASILQTANASCDATINGATISGWTQDTNDDGDWRADTAGTTSTGTGPGATVGTTGVNVGTDVNPGTTGGVYMYTEATNGTTCSGAEINLISPYFDFSTTNKYYRMKINYHMFGAGMGSLHIDVFDGATWTDDVWTISGDQDTLWHDKYVNLANYNDDSVQIRIRSVMGTNFQSDMAIDDITVEEYTPYTYDVELTKVSFTQFEYPIIRLRQADSIGFNGTIKNDGLTETTQTKINIDGPNSFSTSMDFDTLQSYTVASTDANDKFLATSTGQKQFYFETSIAETDGNSSNNYDTLSFQASDTVMAREDGEFTNGIGINTGTIEMGQKFTIINNDTVTTVSFYIPTPNVGDSVQVHFRNFNITPGTIIQSSQPVVLKANQNWYTARLNCAVPVTAGKYFASVEQLVSNVNMGLGYTNKYYTPDACMFTTDGGATWVKVEDQNFDITLLVRLNFNLNVDIVAALDSTCVGAPIKLNATNGKTFSWSPSNLTKTPTAKAPFVTPVQNTTFTVTASFGCGITRTASIPIYTKALPSAVVSNDTTICQNETVVLKANGGSSYQWLSGPSNADYSITPQNTGAYTVKIDSANGCSKSYTIQVNVNKPVVTISGDTLVCSNKKANLVASGTNTYQWVGGPATASYAVYPSANTTYTVKGFDAMGCEATKSWLVKTKASPIMTPIADTGACFTHTITLKVQGDADSYLWSKGSDSASATWTVFKTETVTVTGSTANGCKTIDTIVVERYLPPVATIDNDTTICYGTSVDLSAYGGDVYIWSTGDTAQTVNVSPTVETTYSVEVQNTEGCTADKNVKVSIDPLPIVSWKFKEFQDSVVFTNQSQLADTYLWDFGDGKTSTDENPYHIYDTTGAYTVTLTASNNCGGVDSSFTLNVVVPQTGNISKLSAFGEINIYPVPTNSLLQFTINNQLYGSLIMEVLDATGKQIKTTTFAKASTSYSNEIDLSDVETGIYFIRFTINNATTSLRAIKK